MQNTSYDDGGLTIAHLWREQVRRTPGRVAIEFGARVVTYEALDALSEAFGRLLAGRGIGRGDRVAVLSLNSIEYAAIQLAAAKLGVAVACLNWRQSDSELQYCVELANPKLIFSAPQFLAHATRIAGTLGIDALETTAPPHPAGPALDSEGVRDEDIWSILYTSGTTGWPKGAAISHRAMVARMAISLLDGGVFPGLPSVVWAPMFHMSGTDSTLIALLAGSGVILYDKYDSDTLAVLVTERDIGALPLMPSTIEPLIESIKKQNKPVRTVMRIGSMADLVPLDHIAEISRLMSAAFRNTFGSTEAGLAPASKGVIPPGERPTSFSKTQSSLCAIRLLDDDLKEVPDGAPGEVAIRGPSLFSGYITKDGVDRSPLAKGWFLTGDVMRRAGSGLFDFVDRKKYLIKSGGENIYPAEIERILLASDRIADAAVVREQHDRWGECPVAFVVARTDDVTASEVLALFEGTLARYKHPRRVVFISQSEVPRNTTGKIMRHVLEERLKTLPADAGAKQ